MGSRANASGVRRPGRTWPRGMVSPEMPPPVRSDPDASSQEPLPERPADRSLWLDVDRFAAMGKPARRAIQQWLIDGGVQPSEVSEFHLLGEGPVRIIGPDWDELFRSRALRFVVREVVFRRPPPVDLL